VCALASDVSFSVLIQVVLDLLCSFFDLLAHCPSSIPSSILTACQKILLGLKDKLCSCTESKTQSHSHSEQLGQVLGTCEQVGMKVKALLMAHERRLASKSKFSQVVLLCESFLLQVVQLSELCKVPISVVDSLHFSTATLRELSQQFDALVTNASQMKRCYYDKDCDDDTEVAEQEDIELVHELNRIRKG
jgi:hypothetical protein